jgi:hypothetical protein
MGKHYDMTALSARSRLSARQAQGRDGGTDHSTPNSRLHAQRDILFPCEGQSRTIRSWNGWKISKTVVKDSLAV